MNIKKLSNNLIELSSSTGSAVFAYGEADMSKVKEPEKTLLVGFIKDPNSVFRPGEYEYSDISIIGIESKSEPVGIADIVAINVDGVNVVFIDSKFGSIKKDQQDLIGRIDVLITNVAQRDNVKAVITKFNPAAVVAINYESIEQVSKSTDLTAEEPQKKLKFSEEDFIEEEPVISLYLLEN